MSFLRLVDHVLHIVLSLELLISFTLRHHAGLVDQAQPINSFQAVSRAHVLS